MKHVIKNHNLQFCQHIVHLVHLMTVRLAICPCLQIDSGKKDSHFCGASCISKKPKEQNAKLETVKF